QSQVQPKGGMVFQNGLRALLRQDPDVLVVGEIRDGETAQIAVRAALTGHVVFSTLHAPSAVEAAVRLSDMGVPAYLAADALTGIVSQRLVRRKTANGAYEGRFCLCEVVPAGPRFKEALRRSVDLPELTEAAVCDGAVLLPAVIERVLADGLTDEAELRRVCEGGRALWT
ncbi:MAG: ATPase, T2SS/T4P/T4SS family, partial [Megasphaera sp.]|nr:ATPase, T2SS/T4P/T4SS family [Megasphaera sp.]